MFTQFTLNILIDWAVCISLLFIVYELLCSDYIYNKTGLKTYYYKKDSVHYLTNFVDTSPILFKQNPSNEKLLTDSGWLILVGYILPLLFIIMLLPLIFTYNITLITLFPLILWIYNSIIITIRKKLNDYNELSETESRYRHRFIPISLFIGIILSIIIFVLIISYNVLLEVHMEFIPLLLLVFYLIMDNIILFYDKFIIKYSSNDFRENNNFKNMIKVLTLIIILTVLVLLTVTFISFDINQSLLYYNSSFESFLSFKIE